MIEQRIVPGAPPPAPLSKSQKKKRKAKVKPTESNTVSIPDTTSAALVEKILETTNIQEGAVTLDLVTEPQLEDSLPEEVLLKPSPIVELIHKRLKATTKKISRISIYASTDPEKLNDDQKRTLKTLPTLEAVQKELGEVQKAVEVHEGELVHELASKRAEAAKAERARIADAVAAKEAFNKSKFSTILSFARLHTLIQAADPEALALNLDSAESRAILASADALLGENSDLKQTVIDGFLSGEGEIESVTYSRLLDITELYLNPPRIPTPVQEQVEEQPELKTPLSSVGTGPEVPVIGIPETIPTSGSFHFMQASELETPSLEGAEWVDRGDAVAQEEELRPEFVVEAVNGHNNMDQPIAVSLPVTAEAVVSGNEPIDWADEEGGLPSIDGLHAKFGTSGTATPVIKTPEQVETPVLPVNGDVNTTLPREEEDGFQQARGGRGRGRGFRGVELRGGFRGSFRGGDRGFRGNDRGFRGGGFRGGERGGGFRGKPSNGEWRGGSGNGYGEFRGRGGRGRGRGDRHPDRPPVVSTT